MLESEDHDLLGEVVNDLGRTLRHLDAVVRETTCSQAEELLEIGLAHLRAACDAIIESLEPPEPPIFFDCDDSSHPDQILVGVPSAVEDRGDLAGLRTVIGDLRDTLFCIPDSELRDVAQASLISLKIIFGAAQAAHREMANTLGIEVVDNTPPDQQRNLGVDGQVHVPAPTSTPPRRGVLWDPLAPTLLNAAQEAAERAKEKPATAAVIAVAALPFSWSIPLILPPVLLSDAALQWAARETECGRAANSMAGDAAEIVNLWWVVGKISVRQAVRFVGIEFERTGGVKGVASRAADAIKDPIGTSKSAWSCGQSLLSAAIGHAQWIHSVVGAARTKHD